MKSFRHFLLTEKKFPYTTVFLKKKYDDFNKKFFDNDLPDIPIKLNRRTRSFAIAHATMHTTGRTRRYEAKMIEFSTQFILTDEQLDGMMVHEMIHIWQYHNAMVDGRSGNAGHGRHFNRKLHDLQVKAKFKIPKSEDVGEMEYGEELTEKTYHAILLSMTSGKTLFTRLSPKYATGPKMDGAMEKILATGQVKKIVYGTVREPSVSKVPEKRTMNTLSAYELSSINEKGFMDTFVKVKEWKTKSNEVFF